MKSSVLVFVFSVLLSAVAVAQEHPREDLPYSATITNNEARFVFPLPVRDQWVWGGDDVYEWTVRLQNDQQQYVFGLFVTPPYQGRFSSQQPPAYAAQGKVFEGRIGDATLHVRSDLDVFGQSPPGPDQDDLRRILVVVDDPRTLRSLFYGKPQTAVFASRYPGRAAEEHSVSITYQGYESERPTPELRPKWEIQVDENASIAISANGACGARSTNDSVYIFDSSGRDLWHWDFRRQNRFISAGLVAISGTCDLIALRGHAGYKYTWIVGRNGRRAVVPTTSTPMGVAIDATGKHIALGTGGGDVLLLNRAGEIEWKRVLDSGFGIAGELTFSADGRSLIVGGFGTTAVIGIDGTVKWTGGDNGLAASRDLRSFVSWAQPGHGSPIATISLLNERGEQVWRKLGLTPAAITPDGDLIVAEIYDKQHFEDRDFVDGDPPSTLGVWSRSGTLVRALPGRYGRLDAMSADGRRIITNNGFESTAFDLDGHALWAIPLDRDGRGPVFSEDLRNLLLRRRNSLRWYEGPTVAVDSSSIPADSPETYRIGQSPTDGITIVGRVEIVSVDIERDDLVVVTGPTGNGMLIVKMKGDVEAVVVQEVVGPGTHHFKFVSKLPTGPFRHATATWNGMANELYFSAVR